MLIEDLTYLLTAISNAGVDYDDEDCKLLFKHDFYDTYNDEDKVFIYDTSDDINHNNEHQVYLVHQGLGHVLFVGTYEYTEFRPSVRLVVQKYTGDDVIIGDEIVEIGYDDDNGGSAMNFGYSGGTSSFTGLFKYANSGAKFWNLNLEKYKGLKKLNKKI